MVNFNELFSVLNQFILDWEGTKDGKITETVKSYIQLKEEVRITLSSVEIRKYNTFYQRIQELYDSTSNFHEYNLQSIGWPHFEDNRKNLDLIEVKCKELVDEIVVILKRELYTEEKFVSDASQREIIEEKLVDLDKVVSTVSDLITQSIDTGFDGILKELGLLRLTMQSGFLPNYKTDEELFSIIDSNKEILEPMRDDLLMILAERDLLRAVAGIERDKAFSTKIWDMISKIASLASIYELARSIIS